MNKFKLGDRVHKKDGIKDTMEDLIVGKVGVGIYLILNQCKQLIGEKI